jgi:hypothetical protein
MGVRSRRFTVLAVVLVALNLVLWLAPEGLALRNSLIDQLFGARLIRAEIVVQDTTGSSTLDYRIDRGVVVAVTPGGITLREADGTMQPIPIATTTRLQGAGSRLGLAVLARRGAQVLVTRLANGPATSIEVEALTSAGGQAGTRGKRNSLP